MIVSEDDIARRQVEEDRRLYGSRPEPPDTVEVDESTQLANLSPKRNASEFEAAVDRPAKIRKKGKSHEFNYEVLTVMDWSSGTTPLDAWLNQSALPSSTTALSQQESMKLESDLLAQEIDEIKVFRNVHMAIAPSPKYNDPPLERIEGLDFGAQIYYRNIMDRYPVIPIYLARRLAQANHDRAERLRNGKRKPKESLKNDVTPPNWNERSASNVPDESTHELMTPETHQGPIQIPVASQSNRTSNQYSGHNPNNETPLSSIEQPQPSFTTPFSVPGPASIVAQMEFENPWDTYQNVVDGLASRIPLSKLLSPLTRHAPAQRDAASPPRPPSFGNGRPSPTRLDPVRQGTPLPTPPPSSDFWTGGNPCRRPASVQSRSSSMNSSLHGRPKFDPQEQNPTFTGNNPAQTACDSPRSPDNYLPPPPVELGKVLTFDCDICGQNIKAKRRLDWQ